MLCESDAIFENSKIAVPSIQDTEEKQKRNDTRRLSSSSGTGATPLV